MQTTEKAIKTIGIAILVSAWALQLCGVNHIRLFMHANPFHLAVNCWALWGLWRRPWWFIIPAIAIGWFGLHTDHTAIGFSAALFALMGLQWRLYDCWQNRIFVAIMLTISFLVPQLAFIAHLVPFCIALAIGWVYNIITQYEQDTRR